MSEEPELHPIVKVIVGTIGLVVLGAGIVLLIVLLFMLPYTSLFLSWLSKKS